jgi:DegV family protein with EDD domain
MDLYLPQAEMPDRDIPIIRHTISLNQKSYRSGIDISSEELYNQLATTKAFPTTSQPSAGDFAELFRTLAATDPEILCINMSSGLSGTVNAARLGADMVPEAKVTIFDSKTLSGVVGWEVAAAARAAKAGWTMEQIVPMLEKIASASDTIYTLDDLKYLIHGGRISHMKGLIASVLHIRPIIGVAKDTGAYEQLSQGRTFDVALKGLVEVMKRKHAPGTALRVQILHAGNPQGAERLRELVAKTYVCTWLPTGAISPVLGAHTGPSLVGLGFAALADYPAIP